MIIPVPNHLNLRDPALAERAVNRYEMMYRTCHGAPGKKPEPWPWQLHPPAPDLTDALRAKQWSDSEVFWIYQARHQGHRHVRFRRVAQR